VVPGKDLFRVWQHSNISFLSKVIKANLKLPNLILSNQSAIPFPNPTASNLAQTLSKLKYLFLAYQFIKKLQKLRKMNF
jgi:hypothetical protein